MFSVVTGYAQNKLELLRNKGDELLSKNKYQQAIVVFKEGLELAKQKDEIFYEATFLVNLGVSYENINDWSKAEEYYNYAIVTAQKNNDDLNQAFANRNLSLINIRKGLYSRAYMQLIVAAKYFKKSNMPDGLVNTYISIGNLEYKRENYNEAAHHYRRAIELVKKLVQVTTDSIQQREYLMDFAMLLNNMGDYYRLKNDYDSAIIYLDSALHLKMQLGNNEYMANTMLGLGEVYYLKNDARKAMYYCDKAYQIRKLIGDVKGLPEAANSLAEVNIKLGSLSKSEELLQIARNISLKDTLRKDLLRNYDISRKLYHQMNQLDKAVLFDQLYIDILNELRDEKLNKQIEELKIQYQTEESKRDFDERLRKNEQEKRLMYAGIGALLLFIGLVVFAYLQKKRDKDKIELLMRELNHRVKNNLQVLSSILSLHYEQLADTRSKQLIKETEGRVKAMSFVHKKLYKGKAFTQVVLNILIQELAEELKISYGFNSDLFKIEYQLDEITLDADKAIPAGLLLNELLTNTFKHAYNHTPEPKLMISLLRKHKEITIVVSDNGSGTEPMAQTDSFGVKLIKLLSKQLKAEVITNTKEGTQTQIKFTL